MGHQLPYRFQAESKVGEFMEVRQGHSEAPRFYQRGEESREELRRCCTQDPSLRLKDGSARDDAVKNCSADLSHEGTTSLQRSRALIRNGLVR